MQKALITGGSGGIGLALAEIMAEQGHDLVLVSRSGETLEKIAETLTEKYGVTVSTYEADLSQPGSAQRLYQQTKDEGVEILVNNAGVGYVADFFDGELERNQSMMQLNMDSLTELSYCFGRDFKQQGTGKILNIASVAAFLPGPAQPVYYATKAYVRSLSRALAYSLRGSGVTVTLLHPGPTRTHFFDQAEAEQQPKGDDPVAVAMTGYRAMMRGQVEVTHGLWNKLLTNVLVRLLPYRLQAPIVDKVSDI